MVTSQNQGKLFTRTYLTAIITNLMVCTFGQMLFCAMPIMVSNQGYQASYAGLMVYSFSFSSVLFRPFTGWLATRLPGRKTVSVALILFSVSCAAMIFSPSLWFLAGIRAIQGVVMCLYGTIFGALVSNIVLPSRFDEGIGYYSIGVPAMSFFGPALGLVLLKYLGENGMFILLVIWMLAAAALCNSMQAGEHPVSPPLKQKEKNIFKISFAKGAVFYSIILALVFISHSSLVSFLSLFAQQEGYGSMTPFYIVAGVCIVSVRLIFTLGRRFVNGSNLLLPAMALLGVCMFCLPKIVSLHTPLLLMLAALYGVAMGIVQPGLIALALTGAPKSRRAAATATYYLGLDLGTGLGGVIWGAVAGATNFDMIFKLAACVNFFALIIVILHQWIQNNRGRDVNCCTNETLDDAL